MQQIKINDPRGKTKMLMQTHNVEKQNIEQPNILKQTDIPSIDKPKTNQEQTQKIENINKNTVNTNPAATKKMPKIIVLGNEKGGTGKSTLCLHLAIALSYQGHKVAMLDLDERQGSTDHFLEFRAFWNSQHGDHALPLPIIMTPNDNVPAPPTSDRLKKGSVNYRIIHQIAGIKANIPDVDYLLVDTPGSYASRTLSALVLCDILITPSNDSLMDLDVIGRIDPSNGGISKPSNFAESVFFARKFRAALMREHETFQWFVLRNRLAHLTNSNEKKIAELIKGLSRRLSFSIIDGITERVVYKELFAHGLTVFDLDHIPNDILKAKNLYKLKQRASNKTARQEIGDLCDYIGLRQ